MFIRMKCWWLGSSSERIKKVEEGREEVKEVEKFKDLGVIGAGEGTEKEVAHRLYEGRTYNRLWESCGRGRRYLRK